MKRILSIFAIVALVLTTLAVPVMATETMEVAVISPVTSAAVGDEVTFEVVIANNPGFTNFDWKVAYDPEILSLKSFDNETSLLSGLITASNIETGKISGIALTATTENGTAFYVTFEVIGSTSTSVALENIITDNGDNSVNVIFSSCTIDIEAPETDEPTTGEPTTGEPTTGEPTTGEPTTGEPTTGEPTTGEPTTGEPTTGEPTTGEPTTGEPTTGEPTTGEPTTGEPTTGEPTTGEPTTDEPTIIIGNINGGSSSDHSKEENKEPEKPNADTNFKSLGDVSTGSWYYEAVKSMVDNGIMKGVSATSFAPDVRVTRAMLVTILHRLEKEPMVSGNGSFSDIEPASYYANAVEWAHKSAIINGINDTEFAPNTDITREQIATIIYRYVKYRGMDVSIAENVNLSKYEDAGEISEYAVDAMKYAVASGLLRGRSDSTLNASDYATRAEMAQILFNFFK